jgi:hypothetical protein
MDDAHVDGLAGPVGLSYVLWANHRFVKVAVGFLSLV